MEQIIFVQGRQIHPAPARRFDDIGVLGGVALPAGGEGRGLGDQLALGTGFECTFIQIFNPGKG